MPESKFDLKRKIGPLPLWGWIVVAIAAYYIYTRYYRGSSTSPGSEGYDTYVPDAEYAGSYPSFGGGGAGGGGDGYIPPDTGGPLPVEPLPEEPLPEEPLPGEEVPIGPAPGGRNLRNRRHRIERIRRKTGRRIERLKRGGVTPAERRRIQQIKHRRRRRIRRIRRGR